VSTGRVASPPCCSAHRRNLSPVASHHTALRAERAGGESLPGTKSRRPRILSCTRNNLQEGSAAVQWQAGLTSMSQTNVQSCGCLPRCRARSIRSTRIKHVRERAGPTVKSKHSRRDTNTPRCAVMRGNATGSWHGDIRSPAPHTTSEFCLFTPPRRDKRPQRRTGEFHGSRANRAQMHKPS
jgi:hypothetical protein